MTKDWGSMCVQKVWRVKVTFFLGSVGGQAWNSYTFILLRIEMGNKCLSTHFCMLYNIPLLFMQLMPGHSFWKLFRAGNTKLHRQILTLLSSNKIQFRGFTHWWKMHRASSSLPLDSFSVNVLHTKKWYTYIATLKYLPIILFTHTLILGDIG